MDRLGGVPIVFYGANIAIPDSGKRFNQAVGLLLVIQRLAQFADALGHILFIDLATLPEPLHQFLPRYDSMTRLHQVKQDVETLSAHRHLSGPAKQRIGVGLQ